MNSKQIESIFTAKVSEYITDGYIINLTTMGGSQGEIGKVDLRKNDKIVRLVLHEESDFCNYREMIVLTVGCVYRQTDERRPFDRLGNTIWHDDMEIIEEITWYKIGRRGYFTEDKAEAEAATEKYIQRAMARHENGGEDVTTEAAKEIALRFIKKQPKCATKKLKDIKSITKHTGYKTTKIYYSVELNNGKTYRIG